MTYRYGLLALITLALAGCTVPGTDSLPPMSTMQQAESIDSCDFVKKGCNGRYYAINEEYLDQYTEAHSSQNCLAVQRPIDMIEYSVGFEDGQCTLNTELPDRCNGEDEHSSCEEMREILNDTYR